MKNRPYVTGIIAAVSPVPLFCFTVLWYWALCFGFALGMLQLDRIPQWISVISALPLFISPSIGIVGIVQGIIKRKEKLSWLGILLSIVCLVENFALIYCIVYLGSRY